MPLWFYDLAVYCLQLVIMILVGGALLAVARLHVPWARLLYLKILFAVALVLPLVEPWRVMPMSRDDVLLDGVSLVHIGGFRVSAARSTVFSHAHAFSPYVLAALLILGGFLLRLLWLVVGLSRLDRLRSGAHSLGPHPIVEELRSILRVSPSVLATDKIASPITYGWRAPRVFLPAKFEEMDTASQRAILCHEFLHVRRRDWLWQSAEEIVRALFWFHPAVSWLVGQIRLAREEVVDQDVIAYTGSRRDYLNALLRVVATEPRSVPASPFLSESHLKRRVALILKEPDMSKRKAIVALSASLAALFLAGATAVTLLPMRTMAAAPVQTKATSDHAGWVNGPVSYIITPSERATYEKVHTDQERAEFISQFWARRNPNPGSATNAFKEKFDRKVAYANEHFGAAGIPGWRTDRGRFYILWGPPNDIKPISIRTPSEVARGEVWVYNNLSGKGQVSLKFARTGKGNYQLAPGTEIPQLDYQNRPGNMGAVQRPVQKENITGVPQAGKNGYTTPVCVYCPNPQYTDKAFREKVHGTVTLSVVVGTNGRADDVRVIKSLEKGLDQVSIDTIRKVWRFKPALGPDGKPSAVETSVEMGFHLY